VHLKAALLGVTSPLLKEAAEGQVLVKAVIHPLVTAFGRESPLDWYFKKTALKDRVKE